MLNFGDHFLKHIPAKIAFRASKLKQVHPIQALEIIYMDAIKCRHLNLLMRRLGTLYAFDYHMIK